MGERSLKWCKGVGVGSKEAAGDTSELLPLRGQSITSLLPRFKLILTWGLLALL